MGRWLLIVFLAGFVSLVLGLAISIFTTIPASIVMVVIGVLLIAIGVLPFQSDYAAFSPETEGDRRFGCSTGFVGIAIILLAALLGSTIGI